MNISVVDVETGIVGPKPNHTPPITLTIPKTWTAGGSGSQTTTVTGSNTGHNSHNHE